MTLAQLTFDLPHRAALGAEDFLVSDCNVAAVKLIDAWPEWTDHVQILTGPAASGKTHLGQSLDDTFLRIRRRGVMMVIRLTSDCESMSPTDV